MRLLNLLIGWTRVTFLNRCINKTLKRCNVAHFQNIPANEVVGGLAIKGLVLGTSVCEVDAEIGCLVRVKPVCSKIWTHYIKHEALETLVSNK